MILSFTEIEVILTLVFLAVFTLCGAKRRAEPIRASSLSLLTIDKNWSIVIKGISCVFVLMGHWCALWMDSEGIICRGVYLTVANFALCWFMFFSGYGLSLKNYDGTQVWLEWLKRVKKIYIPLLLVCLITTLLYVVLPDKGLVNKWPKFPEDFNYLHDITLDGISILVMHTLGLWDWYVWCVLIFYSIYFITIFLSSKFKANHTLLLAIFMLVYNVIAYFAFGWEKAHYFRFPWIFMLGHIVAVYKNNPRYINFCVLAAFSIAMLFHLHEWIMFVNFIISIAGLFLFSLISRRYTYEGRIMLFFGSISYFFYLCHMRIGYTLLCYTGIRSMLLLIVITIAISYGLKEISIKSLL